jgi:hypothetical protein
MCDLGHGHDRASHFGYLVDAPEIRALIGETERLISEVSDAAIRLDAVPIHLLANDTACVWRHRFEPATGIVTPFRSGYANAPCD